MLHNFYTDTAGHDKNTISQGLTGRKKYSLP